MGINAMKCERYAGAMSTDSGNVFRSASDFSVDDGLLKVAGIVALGLAAAGCIGNDNSNGNKQEAKYEPSETPTPVVENSVNETTETPVVAMPSAILVKYEGGTAYCSLPPGANLTEDFVRECIGKDMPFYAMDDRQLHEYTALSDKVLYGRVGEPLPENYDPRADPAFKDANFKEPFYVATGKVVEQYQGLDNLDANLASLPGGMSNLLFTKFHTGIAIDDFKSAGVATPEAHGAIQVLRELNDGYGCRYLRDHGIEPTRNKFFVWFIDETEWKEHVSDYADKDGVGWPDLGILIKVPDYVTAGMPTDKAFASHEFAHLWGIRDRDGSGDEGDLMQSPPFSADHFADAPNIAVNIDRKLNTC